MSILIHVLLAIALVGAAIAVVVGEAGFRRRIAGFRHLQWLALSGAVAFAPVNLLLVVRDQEDGGTVPLATIVGSAAILLALVLVTAVSWTSPRRTRALRRILAIGAHPDDLELAAGGTPARLAHSGHEIHALVMSSGSVGGDPSVRPAEALAGSSRLESAMTGMVTSIEERIRRLNPDIIFTHSGHDQHQDHAAVHAATLRAGRRHEAILCYESPSATSEFDPRVFVDIEDYLATKIGAVAAHANQMGKPYMGEGTITSTAAFRGNQARIQRAEGFEPVRVPLEALL